MAKSLPRGGASHGRSRPPRAAPRHAHGDRRSVRGSPVHRVPRALQPEPREPGDVRTHHQQGAGDGIRLRAPARRREPPRPRHDRARAPESHQPVQPRRDPRVRRRRSVRRTTFTSSSARRSRCRWRSSGCESWRGPSTASSSPPPGSTTRRCARWRRSRPRSSSTGSARGLSGIVIDTPAGLGQAVHYLNSLGHTRIAYVRGPHGSWTDRTRFEAITAAAGRARGRHRPRGPLSADARERRGGR